MLQQHPALSGALQLSSPSSIAATHSLTFPTRLVARCSMSLRRASRSSLHCTKARVTREVACYQCVSGATTCAKASAKRALGLDHGWHDWEGPSRLSFMRRIITCYLHPGIKAIMHACRRASLLAACMHADVHVWGPAHLTSACRSVMRWLRLSTADLMASCMSENCCSCRSCSVVTSFSKWLCSCLSDSARRLTSACADAQMASHGQIGSLHGLVRGSIAHHTASSRLHRKRKR